MRHVPRIVPALAFLALLLGLPLTASAECASGFLNPGSTVCLNVSFATTSISASGSSDANIRWTVLSFVNGSGFTELFLQKSQGFAVSYDSTSNPTLFPADFYACAHRGSHHGAGANFQLCLSGS
jgi:hypothetical protein